MYRDKDLRPLGFNGILIVLLFLSTLANHSYSLATQPTDVKNKGAEHERYRTCMPNERDEFSDGDRINVDIFMERILTSLERGVPLNAKAEYIKTIHKAPGAEQFFSDFSKVEKGCSFRKQLFGIIDQGSISSHVSVWVVNSRGCFHSPWRLDWRTLDKKTEERVTIGTEVFGKLEFYIDRRKSPHTKIAAIEADLQDALSTVTRIVRAIWDKVERTVK